MSGWRSLGLACVVAVGALSCGDDAGDGSGGQAATGANAAGPGGPGATASGVTSATGAGGSAGFLADPDYKEGFGKDATGGEGRATYVVTSPADSGPGSLAAAFEPSGTASDVTIVFAVDTVTLTSTVYVGSNVTIDGTANGMNGITFDATSASARGLIVEDPASNIVVRGLNFRSSGTPDSGFPELDLLALDGTNGAEISGVLVDRCTFVQASDGSLDITGHVSNVTVQRSLFYGTAKTMLVKYDARQNISVHHNVFAHNGERNPQVKGDMQLFDFVNNVVYDNDVPSYSDGTPTSPYGTRFWSCASGCDSPGEVVANAVNNAYVGDGAAIELLTDPGGSNASVYLSGNLCSPASNCPASPSASPNAIPSQYAVTTLAVGDLENALLPHVGAPNRTAADQASVDEVATALP